MKSKINRRESLKLINYTILGGVAGVHMFASCKTDTYIAQFFEQTDLELLADISETILPKTNDSPGAKELKVQNYIDTYSLHCLAKEDQQVLLSGIENFKLDLKSSLDKTFQALSVEQKEEILIEQLEQKIPFTTSLKSLVLLSYFTSESGSNQALSYIQTPGRFDGDIPYEEGQKSWALN